MVPLFIDQNVEIACHVSDVERENIVATSKKIIRINNHALPDESGCAVINVTINNKGRITKCSYVRGTYKNFEMVNLKQAFYFKKNSKSWNGILLLRSKF